MSKWRERRQGKGSAGAKQHIGAGLLMVEFGQGFKTHETADGPIRHTKGSE